MNDSIRIGSVFGITIRVHVLFLVLIGLLVLLASNPTAVLAGVMLLFSLVFLHELGHSLVAKRFGIDVLDITFWPLGGMARMSEIPEDSRIEGWIAIAGPAVNFALASIGLVVLLLTSGFEGPLRSSPLTLFIAMNLALGGFNLIPAFPMDGGRILRAWLGRDGNWVRATERAVRVSRWVAFAMIVGGFASGQFMLPIIAVFVWWIGMKELMMVRYRHYGSFFARGPTSPFGEAAGPGWSPLHEVVFGRQRGGAATARSARQDPDAAGSEEDPGERQSGSFRPEIELGSSSGGISDEDIERLEQWHGPLRKRRGD